MESRWSEDKAATFVEQYGPRWGKDLALRTYSSRLLGSEESLVLHGGGNTSVKSTYTNILGEVVPVVYVKASGYNMAIIEPEGHSGLNLEYLKKLRALPDLSDELMLNEFRTHLFDSRAATPSLETLVHAFFTPKYLDHTHADAILALTNQADSEKCIREALGEGVIVLEYVKPGFKLARAAATAFDAKPGNKAMVLMRHGLLTWGETARQAYETTVELVTKAEEYLAKKATHPLTLRVSTTLDQARERLVKVAPVVRGLLAEPSGDQDQPYRRVILQPLVSREVLDIVDSGRGKEIALSPPLTSDHLIRTKPLPLWIDDPEYGDLGKLRAQLSKAVQAYA